MRTLAETTINVLCIAHTALSDDFRRLLDGDDPYVGGLESLSRGRGVNERAAVALTAIRTCYSANKPSEIVALEGAKYFGKDAADGEGGTDADRLFRQIVRSKHTSTLESIVYTFAVEGVSRSLLAQLTRHRQFSFSVQSQRYVRFGTQDRSGGFDYVVPTSIHDLDGNTYHAFTDAMETLQDVYDRMRGKGVPAEDARAVLPNAAATNLVMTGNLRAIIEFYAKRRPGKGAQAEIATLAERLKDEVTRIDAWTTRFFE